MTIWKERNSRVLNQRQKTFGGGAYDGSGDNAMALGSRGYAGCAVGDILIDKHQLALLIVVAHESDQITVVQLVNHLDFIAELSHSFGLRALDGDKGAVIQLSHIRGKSTSGAPTLSLRDASCEAEILDQKQELGSYSDVTIPLLHMTPSHPPPQGSPEFQLDGARSASTAQEYLFLHGLAESQVVFPAQHFEINSPSTPSVSQNPVGAVAASRSTTTTTTGNGSTSSPRRTVLTIARKEWTGERPRLPNCESPRHAVYTGPAHQPTAGDARGRRRRWLWLWLVVLSRSLELPQLAGLVTHYRKEGERRKNEV
uniref:Uncharacterized protein n=1 Tax=Oryza punctata TaxID=4537 RepID=A0A0E0L3Z6_ORYPU